MKYIYRNMKTNEEVEDFMAEEYALNELGVTITPKGKNGELTIRQLENISETVDWFFSGNWIKEKVEEDEGNVFELINEECKMEETYGN